MNIEELLAKVDPEVKHAALAKFLDRFLDPAFGALPKGEIELLCLELLEDVGAIGNSPTEYELVSALRVTRAKSRKLIYERELRRRTPDQLDELVKSLLKRPTIQKTGDLFVLDVENPLVSDHLRAKIRSLGYVSDGSFSPHVVKLPLAAVVALLDSYFSDEQKDEIRTILIAAGAPDDSFKGVLKGMLRKVASRVASESGEAMMDRASEYLAPLVDGAMDTIVERVEGIFEEVENDD